VNSSRAPAIALFGPDGSGKSAVADLVEKRCEAAGVKIFRMHWRPGLLPYRSNTANKNSKNCFNDPHIARLRRGPSAWLVFLYVVIDFVLGYFFLIRPKLKKGIAVVYERYYYDILIDQKRYGLSIPASVRWGMAWLMPVPDTIFLLDAPAEVLHSRKQELSYAEIERQLGRIKECFRGFDNFHVVDVERNSVEDAASIILASIDNK
jgi:thymidylate kinase